MKVEHKVDRPHAVIELVAASVGFALVPLPVHECVDQGIVCRRLHPAPPELELTLARARGVESPVNDALLKAAVQIAEQQRSLLGELAPDSSDLLVIERLSRTGEARLPRINVAHQLGTRSSLLRAARLTQDGDGKSIRRSQPRDIAA
jgi:hypothetical protein